MAQDSSTLGGATMLPTTCQTGTCTTMDASENDNAQPQKNQPSRTRTTVGASYDFVGARSKAAANQWQLSILGSQSEFERPTPTTPPFGEALNRAAAAEAHKRLVSISPKSSAMRITTTIDRIFLNDGLVQVYEGAAEQALRCWISSSNTPYMLVDRAQCLSQSPTVASPSSQQLVYWRICELDRGARSLLGHATGRASRDKEIMDAFHSVVLAFAAQWSPHWISGLTCKARRQSTGRGNSKTSENRIRLALWERARDKLQKVANIDSFRVIFALIIFAWTEKPREVLDQAASDADIDLNSDNCALDTSAWQSPAEGSTFLLVAAMHKLLSIKFKIEGKKRRGLSPWNAPNGKFKASTPSSSSETGVSVSHLQSCVYEDAHPNSRPAEEEGGQWNERLTMARKIQYDLESKAPLPPNDGEIAAGTTNHESRTAANASEVTRMEGTYHMLYWLCVVIDTETSVLRKYPPVVCDEDSEVIAGFHVDFSGTGSRTDSAASGNRGIWDDYIIDISKRKQQTEFAYSWPCDEKKASDTLAFSTPVKVVMFRQISRLQISFWRRASTQSVEQHIRSGLSIIYHWNQIYGRLIDSCRESHASLPASIQSWYVLLAFPWYLAILLFVEMVQTVDMAGSSDKQARSERARSGIFPRLRDRACSDLALLITAIQSTTFMHLEPTFQYVRDSGGNLLLTEPWSEILVHSITTVVKTELKLHDGYCSLFKWKELEESHSRIEKCLWALEQLSDRSPSAHMAHEQLEKLASARRQGRLSFQQIPMASPPFSREMGGTMKSGGPSPASDADSNHASCFDSSVEDSDVSTLGFGDPISDANDTLESALDTYFATHASSAHINPVHLGAPERRPQPSKGDSQTDYAQLLQMLEQTEATQRMQTHTLTSSASLIEPLLDTTSAADQFSNEPPSILETLAQLTDQPVLDLVSLSSDSSSSSVDTAFSLNSADWNLDLRVQAPVEMAATGNSSLDNNALISIRPRESGAFSSATSMTSYTEGDSEDDRTIPASKRVKFSHPSHTTNLFSQAPLQLISNPFPPAYPALAHRLHLQAPTVSTAGYALNQNYVSVPLQAVADREHDDLYGDEDDDELVSYIDGLKRKREHSETDSPTTQETPTHSLGCVPVA